MEILLSGWTPLNILHVTDVSESVSKVLNGTSAQLGYTVPFMLIHAGTGKYRTKEIENTETKQPRKSKQRKTQQ